MPFAVSGVSYSATRRAVHPSIVAEARRPDSFWDGGQYPITNAIACAGVPGQVAFEERGAKTGGLQTRVTGEWREPYHWGNPVRPGLGEQNRGVNTHHQHIHQRKTL